MALPSHVNLIASGPNAFSDLGNQQLQWAGFNRGIEEGNIARMNQADQAQNQYFQQLSEQDRRASEWNAQRQQNAIEAAQTAADRTRQFGENVRQFDVSAAIDREKLAVAKGQEQRQLDAMANYAEALAPDINAAGEARDQALKDYTKAESEFGRQAAAAQAKLPMGKVAFNRLSGRYEVARGQSLTDPKALEALAEVNDQLAQAKAGLDDAGRKYQMAHESFTSAQKEAIANGLQVSKHDNGYALFSPRHNKWWTGKKATYTPPTTTETNASADWQPAPWLTQMPRLDTPAIMTGSPFQAGGVSPGISALFNQQGGAEVAPTTGNSYRVGRFTVSQ